MIDEVHMLTGHAFNAMLKTLEEPPEYLKFVLATTDPQKVPVTVLSRCLQFNLRPMAPETVQEHLARVLEAEAVPAQAPALRLLARAARGSMRDALSLTDQVLSLGEGAVTAQRVRDALGLVPEDEHLALLDLIIERRAGDVFAQVAHLADHGVDFAVLLTEFAEILRAQLAVVLGGSLPEVSDLLREELPKRAAHLAAGDILRMLALVVEIEPHLKRSGQQQLLFETLLVRCALMDRTVLLEEVLRGMGTGGGSAPAREAPARSAAPSVARDSAPPMRAAAPEAPSKRMSAPSASASGVASASMPIASVASGASGAVRERPAPAAAVLADEAPAKSALMALDLNRLVEHWDGIVDTMVREGRSLLGAAMGHATPTAVTAGGVVTLTVDAAAQAELITQQETAILAAVRKRFDGVARLNVKAAVEDAAPRRLNEHAVKADRIAMLRKQSKLLDAAVDALDLELMD
jgi:DNA polymerase-3 subunit gamma/tau